MPSEVLILSLQALDPPSFFSCRYTKRLFCQDSESRRNKSVCKADEDVMRVSKTCPQLEAAAETIVQIQARMELENIRRRIDGGNVQKHHVDQWEIRIGRFNDTLEKWNEVWNTVGSLSELVSSFYDLSYRSSADSRNVTVGREVRESNSPAYFFDFEQSNIAEMLWNKTIAEGIMHAYVAPRSTPEAQSESKASDEEEQEQEEEEASRSESDSEADGEEPNEEFNAEAV